MENSTNIPDLHPMKCRKKTFENKTLIFIRQSQYENMPIKCGGNEIQLYKMNNSEIKSYNWRKFSIGYLVIPSSNDLNENENEYIDIIQSINKNIYRMEESSIPTYIIYPNLPMPSQFTQTQSQINIVANNNEDISYTLPDTQYNKNDIEKQLSFTKMDFNEPKPLSKLKKKSDSINNNKRKYEETELETQIDNNNIEPEKKKMKKLKLHEIYGNDSSSDIEENNIGILNNNSQSTTRLSILQMDDDSNSILSMNNTPSKRVDPFSLSSNNNKRRKINNNTINDDFVEKLQSTVNEVRKKAIKITNNSEESESTELSLSSDKIREVHNIRKIIVNESDKKVEEDGNVNVIIMPMINISIKPPGKQFVKKLKNNSVSKTKLSAYVIND